MPSGNLDPIVTQLIERRREMGIPATQLSMQCGFASTQIGMYESGARSPDIPRLRRWARNLGLNVEVS